MANMNFNRLTEYLDYVVTDKTGQAETVMLDKITTNYTFFMREAEHFTFFKEQVLPALTRTTQNKDLRIWSAACSSGQEPYTLAMIIDEYFGSKKPEWDSKILATDLSQSMLEAAEKGVYSNESISPLPAYWKLNYFKKADAENMVLMDKIKKEVIFRKLNLIDPVLPFKQKFHVIFCRNVMIYFDNKTKDELVEKLYNLTEPGGYLFIGHSESLNRNNTRYNHVIPAVYKKG